ncbi:MAG: Gfo/Idh/MocA family oxidoreductase, partial [Paludibacter sp.]
MERRNFFRVASAGAVGLGLGAACSNRQGTDETGSGGGQTSFEIPDYRAQTKPSLTKMNIKGANDTVVLALIGAGSYGTALILEAAKVANVWVKYVCDVDDTRGGQAIAELKKLQNREPIRVRDMRKVFEDKEVDGVLIATPEHWHALATIRACQAGKDVYVEKCISHDIFEGQQMIKAAMKYDRIIQCGTQNRSADYALTARDYIKTGELGEIVAVHVRELLDGPVPFNEKENSAAPDTIDWDMWLGPAPKVPYNISRNKSWGFYWDYSGGYAMSGGITHQLDLARLVLDNPGFPKSVYCAGGRYFFNDHREVPDYQMATFDYGNFVLTLQAGTCTPYMAKSSPEVRFGDSFPDWTQNATRIEILGTKRMMYV